jgi:hypothetical protein
MEGKAQKRCCMGSGRNAKEHQNSFKNISLPAEIGPGVSGREA